MALQISSTGRIPKDAVPLSREEAVDYQWNQIMNWTEPWDVWPFHYGLASLGILASASGMYINRHYRIKLKLRHEGFLSTMVPMVIAPPVIAAILHIQTISTDIFLKETKCSLCLQYRAAATQIGCAIVYPIVLSPLANFMYAHRYATYRLPYWNDFRETSKLLLKMTRPLGKTLILMTIVQALVAGYVTYEEVKSLYVVQSKLLKARGQDEIEEIS